MQHLASRPNSALVRLSLAAAHAILLAACSTVSDVQSPSSAVSGGVTPGALTERPTDVRREQLVGRWGVASYRQEKDRARVEAQARSQCRLPYAIALGPTDGVMMHLADDPKLYELRVKGGSDGKTYLGTESPPGDWQDREIVSISPNTIVMRFVEADANNRYGTFVYIRCPG